MEETFVDVVKGLNIKEKSNLNRDELFDEIALIENNYEMIK